MSTWCLGSNISLTIRDTDLVPNSKGPPIRNGPSRVHTDDVTWPWKVKVVTPICLEPSISKMAGDTDLIGDNGAPKMSTWESNGHVTDDGTWPWRSRSWPQHVLCTVSHKRLGDRLEHLSDMGHGESCGHVTEDVTWRRMVKDVNVICLGPSIAKTTGPTYLFVVPMGRVGIVEGVGEVEPPGHVTRRSFWVKIGFKFQSLGKILKISAAELPSSFRSIPTLPIGNEVWRVEWSGARCRRVCQSSYSKLITYCHSTFTIDTKKPS